MPSRNGHHARGCLLTVNFRQPSHEFTFNVGIDLIQTNDPNPHQPTGIVVACQSERSQIFNRQACMSMLKAKLYDYYREQKEKENSKFAGEKKDIGWGNQIRSYVFQPYTMVKDHRTRYSVGNIQAVMDGELDDFMNAYLVAKWKGLPMDGSGDDDDEE